MNAVETALYARLSTDATLLALVSGAYRHVAPASASLPFVIFAKQSGNCEYTQGGVRTRDLVYVVKAVDDPQSNNAGAADARIDALLTDHLLTLSGATNTYLRRAGDVDFVERVEGVIYRHCGGLYEIQVLG
jgi:hypothetical protein